MSGPARAADDCDRCQDTHVLAGSEGTVMFARKSPGARPGRLAGADLQTRDRGNAIIGHRLPNGRLYIHAPSEACTFCDRARQVTS